MASLRDVFVRIGVEFDKDKTMGKAIGQIKDLIAALSSAGLISASTVARMIKWFRRLGGVIETIGIKLQDLFPFITSFLSRFGILTTIIREGFTVIISLLTQMIVRLEAIGISIQFLIVRITAFAARSAVALGSVQVQLAAIAHQAQLAGFSIRLMERSVVRLGAKAKAGWGKFLQGAAKAAPIIGGVVAVLAVAKISYEGLQAAMRVVQSLFERTSAIAKTTQALNRLTTRLNFNTRAFQEYSLAAQLSGLSTQEFGSSVTQLDRVVRNSQTGNKESVRLFRELGVAVRDTNGEMKSTDQVFRETAAAISAVSDPTEQARLATAAFGENGRHLLPLMRDIGRGSGDLRREMTRLGGGFSEDGVAAGEDFRDSMVRVNTAMDSVKNQFLETFGPPFATAMTAVSGLIGSFADLLRHSNIIQASLIVLGIAVTIFGAAFFGAMWPVILLVGAVALAIGGIVLSIDELITTMQGGDTILRRLMNRFLGLRLATDVINGINVAIQLTVIRIQQTVAWLARLARGVSSFTSGRGFSAGFDADPAEAAPRTTRAQRAAGVVAERRATLTAKYGNRIPTAAERQEGRRIPAGASGGGNRVDQRNNYNINVSGVTDPEEVARQVQIQVQEHSDRQNRQVQRVLAPAGAS